ncbi:MAG: ABC transporter permease [Acidobacteriota bacterium]
MHLADDARSAFQRIRADRNFFVFAALIAGLGIGASTAVFSVLSPLLLQPLPFPEPDRLVWIDNTGTGGLSSMTSRTSNLRDFRELAKEFDGLSGYNAFFTQASYNLNEGGKVERLAGATVAHDLLDVLGVRPAKGRNFSEAEGQTGGPRAVMLTHRLWASRFAEDPDIVGKALSLNDEPREVVGVLPPTFDFKSTFTPGAAVDFLLPFPIDDTTDNWGNTLTMVGRLTDTATPETAQAELDNIIEGLEERDPERWGLGAVVRPMQKRIAGPYRTGMLLLAAAAGATLLIVCVNLSNLLLAKAPSREQEIAVRSALGAGRKRLLRQLLIESLALAGAGAALGIGLAVLVTRTVASSTTLELPLLQNISVDLRALGFSILLATIAGLAMGIAPALQLAAGDPGSKLQRGRATSADRRSTRLREGLVVAEVALACLLLVFGGLLLRSFQELLDVDLGFRPSETAAWKLSSSRDFESLQEATAFYSQIAQRVADLPGVESVGLTDDIPLGTNRSWGIAPPTPEMEAREEGFGFFPHVVDHGYVDAMGIPLVAGRNFTPNDVEDSERVLILNEWSAKTIFGDDDPINRTINYFDEPARIVGVVADVRHLAVEQGAGHEVYMPYTQFWNFQTLELVVRSSIPADTLATSISSVITRFDPGMPSDDYVSLSSVIDRSISPRRFTFALLAVFAGVSLLLAALGIYGVLSCAVSERIPEIGIRMALGESSRSVGQRVVGRTLMLAGIGIVLGLGASFLLSGAIRSLLFGIAPTDPTTFVSMAIVLLAVGALAGAVPAWRAASTDPVEALERG